MVVVVVVVVVLDRACHTASARILDHSACTAEWSLPADLRRCAFVVVVVMVMVVFGGGGDGGGGVWWWWWWWCLVVVPHVHTGLGVSRPRTACWLPDLAWCVCCVFCVFLFFKHFLFFFSPSLYEVHRFLELSDFDQDVLQEAGLDEDGRCCASTLKDCHQVFCADLAGFFCSQLCLSNVLVQLVESLLVSLLLLHGKPDSFLLCCPACCW